MKMSIKQAIKSIMVLAVIVVSYLTIGDLPALAGETISDDGTTTTDKPLLILVYDQTCKVWCKQVRPVIKELQDEYHGKVGFAELDATESVLPAARKQAKELGIGGFFADAADYVPVVLIFTAQRKLVKELPGPKSKQDYEAALQKAVGK